MIDGLGVLLAVFLPREENETPIDTLTASVGVTC